MLANKVFRKIWFKDAYLTDIVKASSNGSTTLTQFSLMPVGIIT